jgi:hypothetical protein
MFIKEKRNYTSITHSYFTKCSDVNGELCICTFLDEKGNRCGKTYRNMGSSTGNLLRHLDEAHQICSNSRNNKKVLYIVNNLHLIYLLLFCYLIIKIYFRHEHKTVNHILQMFRDNVKNQC